MPYKVVMKYSDGEEEQDEIFDTEAEANAFGVEQIGNYHTGAEILHMSNPGDYPSDGQDDEVEYDVIEVER